MPAEPVTVRNHRITRVMMALRDPTMMLFARAAFTGVVAGDVFIAVMSRSWSATVSACAMSFLCGWWWRGWRR